MEVTHRFRKYTTLFAGGFRSDDKATTFVTMVI